MSVTPLVVPICCTNNPVSSDPVFPSLSRMRFFSVTSSLWIVPREIACGSFLPVLQKACVCRERCVRLCSAHPWPPLLGPGRGAAALKRTAASLATLMCHGQATLLCSHFPLAVILSLFHQHRHPRLSRYLSLTLSEVSSLYWMVQKQNHKPISVTLAMRLDGPNLSPSGAIGSTPVSLKRPLSCGERGSFLFGDNCN